MWGKIPKEQFSHYGWLGFCPIYLVPLEGDVVLAERHRLLRPVLFFNAFMFQVANGVMGWLYPDFTPGFPIQVTGVIRHE